MNPQEATLYREALNQTWLNPARTTTTGMKALLQDLERYRAGNYCTEAMYQIFEDMLVNWIAAREKRKAG